MSIKTKTSNIKSKEYYKEAEDMEKGWGKTLLYIDKLKDKILFDKNITLNEFCYSLYGNGHCSHCWEAFQYKCVNSLNLKNKKMLYDCWNGLFRKWLKEEYNVSDNSHYLKG